jgi:ribosome-associated translation inhibitor RaiA
MKVDVRGRHLDVSDTLRAYALRRVQFAIGPFEPRIARVEVSITDVNGPRGGLDKSCVISVLLQPAGSVLARGAAASAYSAVDRAASRIRTILVRRLRIGSASRRNGQGKAARPSHSGEMRSRWVDSSQPFFDSAHAASGAGSANSSTN